MIDFRLERDELTPNAENLQEIPGDDANGIISINLKNLEVSVEQFTKSTKI